MNKHCVCQRVEQVVVLYHFLRQNHRLYNTVQYSRMLYYTVQYSRMLYYTVQYNRRSYYKVQYNHKLYYTVVSHSHITLRWPSSIHVQKVIPSYLNDTVLQSSQTGYQIKGMSLQMQAYSEFLLTLKTLPGRAGLALRR